MSRHLDPFECDIIALGPRGAGLATAPDGRPVLVRGGVPGSRVAVIPTGRRKGVWTARRAATIRPPPGHVEPPCPLYGTCGGCTLQELDLETQRALKHARALTEVGFTDAIVHPPRGGAQAYGYRNKIELSFGVRRYLDEASHAAGEPIDGVFLGFHAPGRFDRVVDAPRCLLVSEALNALVAAVRAEVLRPGRPPPWDPRVHTGFWRHLVLREAAGGTLAVVVTSSPPDDAATAAVEAVAGALLSAGATGVAWWVNDGLADVAQGATARTWGATSVDERVGPLVVSVSATSFLQTNTEGAVVLYDTVREAAGTGRLLLDLYCGTGAIGSYLADRFERVVGIEEVASAVGDARRNAERSGVSATFVHAKVEDALDHLAAGADVHVVVDPPRAGLHPKVVARLATLDVASLVYVACAPASLGRDAVGLMAGGWRPTDLWTVDLFPQTPHLEVVARFTRPAASPPP